MTKLPWKFIIQNKIKYIKLMHIWNKIQVVTVFQSLIQSAFYVFHFEFLSSFDQIFSKNTLFLQCHLQKFIKIQKIVNFDLLAKLISFNPGHKSSEFVCIFWKITKTSFARHFFSPLHGVLKAFICYFLIFFFFIFNQIISR